MFQNTFSPGWKGQDEPQAGSRKETTADGKFVAEDFSCLISAPFAYNNLSTSKRLRKEWKMWASFPIPTMTASLITNAWKKASNEEPQKKQASIFASFATSCETKFIVPRLISLKSKINLNTSAKVNSDQTKTFRLFWIRYDIFRSEQVSMISVHIA